MQKKSISHRYENLIESGEIVLDREQSRIVPHLQKLQDFLTYYHAKTQKKGILGQLQGRLYKRRVEKPKGLYIYGGVGRGKSFLMDLFYNSVDCPKQRLHFHEFMIRVHDYVHEARQNSQNSQNFMKPEKAIIRFARDLASNIDLLCFDEFHVTDIADAMIIGRLFTALFEAGLVIVATSNWAINDLYKDGLQRDRVLPFLALMHESMTELHLDSDTDYRLIHLAGQQVYFYPNDKDNKERYEALFADMVGGNLIKEETVTVKGRVLKFPQTMKNILRTDFTMLCGQALGAEDYLRIAKKFETIFVEGVPSLHPDQRDLAKRFMVMVDAFYECKARLVILAECAPDQIYSQGLLKKEFQRTVSRLMEMQSESYLETFIV